MATVTIGNHSKIVSRPADQARIRAFYRDVLGCELTKQTPDVDIIRFEGNFFLTVLYRDQVLGAEGARSSIWLEVRSDDPAALNARIMKFGVHRIENPDADHLYFQAPGGQVFRVVALGEDLSRFER
jgi:catechol 2,3-dioxygenase-like lactoylglutathione lyase family enzyme